MAAYSAASDLLLGKIPLPTYIDADKVVQDAADEIDSKLGHLWETPFDVSDQSALVRPARLLLKRINNFLASGRLILQIASPEENSNLHAYGWSLIKEATAALDSIAAGDVLLDGAVILPGANVTDASVPLISNLDSESQVESFYAAFANPRALPYAPRRWAVVPVDGFGN